MQRETHRRRSAAVLEIGSGAGGGLLETRVMTEPDVAARLRDAAALWLVAPGPGAEALIDAACDALVAGIDSPSLRMLAGESPRQTYFRLRPLVEVTLAELDQPPLPESGDDLEVAATRVMCRLLLDDQMSSRELAAWVHRNVGHGGARTLQPLVELDDAYDAMDYIGTPVEELDASVRTEATSLLAGSQINPSS